jgi:hypothetical protein
MNLRQDLQVHGLRDGVHLIKNVVREEVERLSGESHRVVLGGFSMGSALALWSIFTGAAFTSGKLGGFVGLSAWMPFTQEAMAALDPGNPNLTQVVRVESLTSTFLDVLGIGPFTSCEIIQDSLLQMPSYLGHGTDVRRSNPTCLQLPDNVS